MNRVKQILTAAAMAAVLTGCGTSTGPTASKTVIAPAVHVQVTTATKPQPILADVPTTQPALPPGHPDLSQLNGAGDSPALPPGHPALGGATGSAPGALPPGHPQIGSIGAAASTQPAVNGVLTIHAVQKTAGAAPAGTDDVNIDLYFRDQLWDKTSAKLDKTGTLKITGLPAQFGIQPVVKITHAGVVYSAVGELMDAQHPEQSLEVPVYETAATQPQWSIEMRHVIVSPSPNGLDVMEMLDIQCPGDRAWAGTADAAGKRTSLALPLPQGAKDLKIGGSFSSDLITLNGGVISTSQAIVPGDSKYQLQYTVPASNNTSALSVTAPVKTGHVLVFVPDDGTSVVPTPPLQLMGSQQMGQNPQKTRYYMATQIEPGQKLQLVVSDLNQAHTDATGTVPEATPAAAVATSDEAPVAAPVVAASVADSEAPKLLALIGGGVVLLIGTAALLIKRPHTATSRRK
jgi:hypothetical protein